jgi:hypothetical protein
MSLGLNIELPPMIPLVKLTVTQQASIGFTVTESWTEGNSYTCHGNPGDRVCIWYRVAHTACKSHAYLYAISKMLMDNIVVIREPGEEFINSCEIHGKQNMIVAPNQQNEGGGVICRYNDECRSMGERFWDCYGRQDEHLRYCPPPGYPPKLYLDKGPLQQCSESVAIWNAGLERMRGTIAAKGEPAWKDQQRKSKKLEDRLEREDEEKWGTIREREKMDEERIRRKLEAEAEEKKKKLKDGVKDMKEDAIEVDGKLDL